MKHWWFILPLVGICCGAMFSACNSTEKKEKTQFQKDMEKKWEGKIKPLFEANLKPGTFTKKAHNKHALWSQGKCELCHPGGDPKKIPPVPDSCYDCHDRQTKIPTEGFGPPPKEK